MDNAGIASIFNYHAVDDAVSTSGQPSESEFQAIAQSGFEVIINLALHDDPRYSLPDEAGLVKSLGMEYVHIPVQFGAPTEEDLLAFFSAMEKYQGRKLFIHCAANKRVTAFFGLYRAMQLNWDVGKAFELMRDVWEPDPVWSTFIAHMLEKNRR